MSDSTPYPPKHVPAHDLPMPSTVSEVAQGILALPAFNDSVPWPADLTDLDAVAAVVAARDAPSLEAPEILASSCFATAPTGVPVVDQHLQFGDVSIYEAVPEGFAENDPRVFLSIHGAWITGGGELSRLGAEMTAGALGVRAWAVDYRMPPYFPYPAPLDDSVAAYRKLLETHRPEDIAVGGVSGGGNIVLAMLLRARDEGLPLPSAALVYTPFADMTLAGDSMHSASDPTFSLETGELQTLRALYATDHDWMDPYISPVFGDFAKGFPPTMLTSGTRDFLLSDTVRLHRKLRTAGIEAELHVWEAAPHFLFLGLAPEDLERNVESKQFLDRHWGSPAPEPRPVVAAVEAAEEANDPLSSAHSAIVGVWSVEQQSPTGKKVSALTFRDHEGTLVAEGEADEYGTTYGDVTTNGDEVSWVATIRKPFKMSITTRVVVTGNTFVGEAKGRIGKAMPVTGTRGA